MGTDRVALVLPGGGARTAYQVGVLAAIAEHAPHAMFPILTGVSGGAVNAAFLANHQGTLQEATADLVGSWQELTLDKVFQTSPWSMFWNVIRWGSQLLSGGLGVAPSVRSLVDTEPLRATVLKFLAAQGRDGVARNIERGRLSALAVTTTNYGTGQAETFVQGEISTPWERPYRRSVQSVVTVDHVLASAAIPIVFPAVQIGDQWHGDGGVRLTTPLSPAVHLGADRILAISTLRTPSARPLAVAGAEEYPAPARVAGVLVNAMFLDNVDFDVANLEQINRLVACAKPGMAPPELRPIAALVLRPSEDLGQVAMRFEKEFPPAFRYLSRGWGIEGLDSQDLLATLFFTPGFINHLIDLGRRDATARMAEILSFLPPR